MLAPGPDGTAPVRVVRGKAAAETRENSVVEVFHRDGIDSGRTEAMSLTMDVTTLRYPNTWEPRADGLSRASTTLTLRCPIALFQHQRLLMYPCVCRC